MKNIRGSPVLILFILIAITFMCIATSAPPTSAGVSSASKYNAPDRASCRYHANL